MGVWIETISVLNHGHLVTSHPSWVCGLKQRLNSFVIIRHEVTPFVGVWIETFRCCCRDDEGSVTPFVGVWIETQGDYVEGIAYCVTPFVGVWIETSLW